MIRTDLRFALALGGALIFFPPASAMASMSGVQWLDLMQRAQNVRDHRGHVHSRGQLRAVDHGAGAVTILHPKVASPDKGIWMPSMVMVFHVTNPAKLRSLRPGDMVEFAAARRRGAIMVTDIRQAR